MRLQARENSTVQAELVRLWWYIQEHMILCKQTYAVFRMGYWIQDKYYVEKCCID